MVFLISDWKIVKNEMKKNIIKFQKLIIIKKSLKKKIIKILNYINSLFNKFQKKKYLNLINIIIIIFISLFLIFWFRKKNNISDFTDFNSKIF